MFWDDFEYGLDEQLYILSTKTGYTQSEILSLTRIERLAMFERIRKDIENDLEWKRTLLDVIVKSASPRF